MIRLAALLYFAGFAIYGAVHVPRHADENEPWVVVVAVAIVSLAWPFLLVDDVLCWWEERKSG